MCVFRLGLRELTLRRRRSRWPLLSLRGSTLSRFSLTSFLRQRLQKLLTFCFVVLVDCSLGSRTQKGVGAGGADPCNPSELPFVYHPDGQSFIKISLYSCVELEGFQPQGKPYSFLNNTNSYVSSGEGSRTSAKKDLSVAGRGPDHVFKDRTQPSQVSYRFPQPILHCLCTLGYAIRAVLACACEGEPSMVQSVQRSFLAARISRRDLDHRMWKDEGQNRLSNSVHQKISRIPY